MKEALVAGTVYFDPVARAKPVDDRKRDPKPEREIHTLQKHKESLRHLRQEYHWALHLLPAATVPD